MLHADATIGDASRLTLVTKIHLVALALIVVIALLALRDRRRADRDVPVRYPNWPLLAAIAGSCAAINAALITQAAWH
jgi:hypothetical protein